MCRHLYFHNNDGRVALCDINNSEHIECYLRMREAYDRLFHERNFMPNNECTFYYERALHQCPCYDDNQ